MLQKLQHAISMENVPASKCDAWLFSQLRSVADGAKLIATILASCLFSNFVNSLSCLNSLLDFSKWLTDLIVLLLSNLDLFLIVISANLSHCL